MKKLVSRMALLALLSIAAAAPLAQANDWPIPPCWPNCLGR
jgi:hypothetical protein